MTRSVASSILFLSLTITVPARRRTWQQAQALARRGWNVTVIGPRRRGQARRSLVEGVEVLGFPQPFEGATRRGLLLESAIAALLVTAMLAATVLRRKVDVIQVVNPPDWPMLLVCPFRLLGVRIVYDRADDAPSLYRAKFPGRGLLFLVRLFSGFALRSADFVIASNELYRRHARRCVHDRHIVTAIRSFPASLPPVAARRPMTSPTMIGYLGLLGGQDGVDLLIGAVSRLRDRGFDGYHVEIVGDGPVLPALRALARRLGVESDITFAGFLEGSAREAALDRFDIAVIADRPTCYTHRISMNKVFVYASRGIATASTRLRQTERLLGDAAVYAPTASPDGLADALARLLDAPTRFGYAARIRHRAEREFDWTQEAERYVAAVESLRISRTRHAASTRARGQPLSRV